MDLSDTIVAISSSVGTGARIIVRLSGANAIRITGTVTDAHLAPFSATRAYLSFAGLRAPAQLYVFRAPRSYTCDDLVEFHLPGNALLARMLLDHLTRAGARAAEPGEFTARAYFNGRLDLAEAEGVAATIAAGNEQELAAARQLLAGELSRRLRPAMDAVAETLALVEAGIDFADEEVTFIQAAEVRARVEQVDAMLAHLLAESARFEPLTREPTVVLVGRPNAGKSTLLNALAGHERAVVSPVAGTTRDALSAEVALRRGIVRVIDVAGLGPDEALRDDTVGSPMADNVERQMRAQALRAAETADVLVLVRDITDPRPPIDTPRPENVLVLSKSDLAASDESPSGGPLLVSAATGVGLDALRDALDRAAFGDRSSGGGGTSLALNARHVQCVEEARAALRHANDKAAGAAGPELVALDLRDALDALGRVLGAITPDDLLGRIFSTFCIGK